MWENIEKREDFDRRITPYPHTWGKCGGDGGKKYLEAKYDSVHIYEDYAIIKLGESDKI